MREKLKQIVKRAAHHCLPSNTQELHINLLVTELLASGVVVSEEIAELKAHNERLLDAWARAVGELSKANAECAQLKAKWIPVTERLPELIPCNAGTAYSEAVIVWTDGRKAMIAVWDGIDFLCAADYWEAWGENITHWMPLPEPPMRKEDK